VGRRTRGGIGLSTSVLTLEGESALPVAERQATRFDPTHHFAFVDGVQLHWAELGPSTGGPAVLMLHGMNDCYFSWASIAPALADKRRLLLLDLPGYGLSDRPDASYALEWYALVIAHWLEHQKLDEVDIVGHSYGGSVALELLLHCPQRIRRLAVVAPGGLGRDITFILRFAALPGLVESIGQPFMALCTRLALHITPNIFSPEQVEALCAMNARPGTARTFGRTVQDVVDWRGGQRRGFWERAAEIPRLPPMAVFWGGSDVIIPAAHGSAFADAVEGSLHVSFANCGHHVHHEQPQEFAQALGRFLDNEHAVPARIARTLGPSSAEALNLRQACVNQCKLTVNRQLQSFRAGVTWLELVVRACTRAFRRTTSPFSARPAATPGPSSWRSPRI
jgi:pimeloyl-ACP methyl ester carboxylesterase